VGEALRQHGLILVTAESFTGGWLASVITSVPSSTFWFDRGFITHSDRSKHDLLGVPEEILKKYGSISEEVVREMAKGALKHSLAHLSAAITGIAGWEDRLPSKPIGTVCLAWAFNGTEPRCHSTCFVGDPDTIKRQAIKASLKGILEEVKTHSNP
jgi:nicotinamide-nucleotide amidase